MDKYQIEHLKRLIDMSEHNIEMLEEMDISEGHGGKAIVSAIKHSILLMYMEIDIIKEKK